MTNELPRPPWQMDWTAEALHAFESMPQDGKQLVLSARAELVTATDPYYQGIDRRIPAALDHCPPSGLDQPRRRAHC